MACSPAFSKPGRPRCRPSSSCRFRFCESRACATVVPPNSRRRLPPRYHSMKYRPSGKAAQLGLPLSLRGMERSFQRAPILTRLRMLTRDNAARLRQSFLTDNKADNKNRNSKIFKWGERKLAFYH